MYYKRNFQRQKNKLKNYFTPTALERAYELYALSESQWQLC